MSKRELREHQVNPANDRIRIQVLDDPGHGGACHEYMLSWVEAAKATGENGCGGPEERMQLVPADGLWDLATGKVWRAQPIPPWLARIRELVAAHPPRTGASP